ncbi:MAG: zinc-dependent alcohol dehydrogenase family protein [Alphaproteobacteria bacterium]
MKTVSFAAFGPPHEVTACVDAPDPGPPDAGEIVVEVEAFPINPVDLLTIEGRYAVRPPLPAIPGSECVGRVAAVGAGVARLKSGDRVLPLGRGNWTQRMKIPADAALKLPDGGDALQLAMLKINPATAYCLLKRQVALAPGDWLIQDAANSGVGSLLVRLARAEGVRTVNVVRREALIAPLAALGADVVLTDGADLPARVAEATGGADIRLAVDAVAGETCGRLAACLGEGGTVVNYGLLSGRPCAIEPHHIVFRGITLTGFWLMTALGAMDGDERARLYVDLADRIVSGALAVTVEATYGIEDIGAALEHAAREGRSGKVLVTPNGPVS